MGVFLEALALGTPDIPDTRVANILQDRLSRKLREEVKTTENVSLFDKRKEIQKNRMLPDRMHPIFKQKAKYWPVRKIAAAVTVLKTGRTYEGDPTDWKQEAVVQGIRYFPQGVGEPEGSEEPNMSEVLDTSEEKFITRVIGMAIKEEPKDEDIPTKMRRFTRSHTQKRLQKLLSAALKHQNC